MNFEVQLLGYGALVPAVVALAIYVTARRMLPGDAATRYPAALSVVGGFVTGYALLPWAPLNPSSHWHWLPYLALFTMLAGPVCLATGVGWLERIALHVAVAIVCAFVLVPTWEKLQTARLAYVIGLAASIAVISLLLEPLAKRNNGPVFPTLLVFVGATAAVVLGLSGSMKFAQLAGVIAAVAFGSALGTVILRSESFWRGAVLPFTVLVLGLLFVGYVNSFSNVPAASYALVGIAPLSLWLCAYRRLAQLPRIARAAASIVLVVLPLAVALILAVTAAEGG